MASPRTYRLIARLAESDAWETWRGVATEGAKEPEPATLKILAPHAASPEVRAALARRVEETSSITHPALLLPWEVGEVEGRVVVAGPHALGHDLGLVLGRLASREVQLSVSRAVHLVAEAANAVSALHLAGIVHGSLAPGDLFVTFDGAVRVSASGVRNALEEVPATRQMALRGRRAYRAPELARGQATDPRADVYALGAIAYELSCGTSLESAGPRGTSTRSDSLVPPSRVDRRVPMKLDPVILRALETARSRRYRDAAELREALWAYLDEMGEVVTPAELAEFAASVLPNEVVQQRFDPDEPSADSAPFAGTFTLAPLDVSAQASMGPAPITPGPLGGGIDVATEKISVAQMESVPPTVEPAAAPTTDPPASVPQQGASEAPGAPSQARAASATPAPGMPARAPDLPAARAAFAPPPGMPAEAPPLSEPEGEPLPEPPAGQVIPDPAVPAGALASGPQRATAAAPNGRRASTMAGANDTLKASRADPEDVEEAFFEAGVQASPPPQEEAAVIVAFPPTGEVEPAHSTLRTTQQPALPPRRRVWPWFVVAGIAPILIAVGYIIGRQAPVTPPPAPARGHHGQRVVRTVSVPARPDPAPSPGEPPPKTPPSTPPALPEGTQAETAAPAPPEPPRPSPAPHRSRHGRRGRLTILSNRRARVFIDGRDTGRFTPVRGLRLKAGRHVVTLIHPRTGRTRKHSVVVRAGKQARLRFRFR